MFIAQIRSTSGSTLQLNTYRNKLRKIWVETLCWGSILTGIKSRNTPFTIERENVPLELMARFDPTPCSFSGHKKTDAEMKCLA